MELTTLVNKTAPFTFEHDDVVLKGEFFKNRVTPNYLKALRKMEEDGMDEEEQGYKILADSIQSWNMTNNGEPFPPTIENLREVPLTYLIELGKKLGDLRDANFTNGTSSPNGSQPLAVN